MAGDTGKKLKVGVENAEHIHGDFGVYMDKLQEIQDQLEKINEEASDKVLEVEQKYNGIRKPIYDKRNDIIKTIGDFWLTAFLSHPALGDLLSEEDQKIFKYLTSIEVEDFKDVKSGYSITFHFNPNPYFEDSELTKTFAFLDEGTTKITATPIKWKKGMGIPNGVIHEKKGSKRSHADESFFTWFSEIEQKDDMDEIRDDVAELIKEDLWPNPLAYFHNEADEVDFHEEGGDNERKGGDGSEEGDDQQDDEKDGEDDDEEEDA